MTASLSAIDAFEEQLQAAGTRYTFLQDIKAYIADLCDMLQVSVTTRFLLSIQCCLLAMTAFVPTCLFIHQTVLTQKRLAVRMQ